MPDLPARTRRTLSRLLFAALLGLASGLGGATASAHAQEPNPPRERGPREPAPRTAPADPDLDVFGPAAPAPRGEFAQPGRGPAGEPPLGEGPRGKGPPRGPGGQNPPPGREPPPPPRPGEGPGGPGPGGFGPGPGPGGPGRPGPGGPGPGPGFGPGPGGPGGFDRPPPGGFPPGSPGFGPHPAHGPDWQSLERDDPEMYALLKQDQELERTSHELGLRYRMAPKAEREKIAADLKTALGKHFDVRQQRRELQIKRMEEELRRLRDSIGKRNEGRDAIIEKRLQELKGDSGDLDF